MSKNILTGIFSFNYLYYFLITLPSINRWLVLFLLIYSIFLAAKGYLRSQAFSTHDNFIRHLTATITHIQLLSGLALYMMSPIVKLDLSVSATVIWINEHNFFKYVHIGLMVISVVLVTIGSAKAKRMHTDREKYRTMLFWFFLSLNLILFAIPWPFSPLASRPFRYF